MSQQVVYYNKILVDLSNLYILHKEEILLGDE